MRSVTWKNWLATMLLAVACSNPANVTPGIISADGGSVPPGGDDAAGTVEVVEPDLPTLACATNEDCDPYFCDTESHECVECLITSHCPGGHKCIDNECVAQEDACTGDAQCTAKGLVCDEEKGICVECVESPDCPTGEYCLDGKCLDWVCTPDAKWCADSVANQCNDEGSALLLEEDCNDGNACTVGDACVNGVCAETEPKDCDDGNPCTDDLCDPESGCYIQYNDAPCDDGTDCTEGDLCKEGICVSGELVCECAFDADCLSEEDGNLCNGTLFCQNGFCIINPDTIVTCDLSEDPCLTIECDPESGSCVETVAEDGLECDDEDSCTLDDACQDGVCHGNDVDCDDGSPCTLDMCDSELGCLHEPISGADCDDGNQCTWPDACLDGVCIGEQVDCEDGNPCTANSCLPAEGCQSEVLEGPCEDGDACTVGDTCVNAVCVGEPLVCEDDGNLCTTDFCDVELGCVYQANDLPCDDGNACTSNDHCQGGECLPGELLFECDDDNPCTTDSCDIDSGACIYTPNVQPCDDGDACTEGDQCANGICVSGTLKDCDDDNSCTDDSCNAQGSCVHVPVSGACDDGNPCTVNDSCQAGACQPGQPLNCNDSNACTNDACDPAQGCVHEPNNNPCSDNDACTLGDACVDGACVGAEALDCEDGNPCTDDSCDAEAGCLNVPNALPCDDENACSEGDYCAAGICIAGAAVQCNDDNLCTDDSCDSAVGCVYAPNTLACEDGDPCTFGDQCGDGSCQAGDLTDCDDGNPCTEDVCNYDSCLHPFADGACDDGEACTINDQCNNGACSGTEVANCGCYAVEFDGQSGHGVAPYKAALALPGTFTMEFWFKQKPGVSIVSEQVLLSRWEWSNSTDRVFRFVINGTNSLQFMGRGVSQNGNEVKNLSLTVSVPADQAWHHVAVVNDLDELRLYLDGSLADTHNGGFTLTQATVPAVLAAAWVPAQGAIGSFFKGLLDEVRISDTVIYTGDSFQPSGWLGVNNATQVYWGANQNQFNTLFDVTDHYAHALLKGTTNWSTDTPGTECVPVPNYPPSRPVISIQPPNPLVSDNLECVIDQDSEDMEGDPVSYSYSWYLNGSLQGQYTEAVLPSSATSGCPTWECDKCQKWSCRVIPSDGKPGYPGWASVQVGKSVCKECTNGSVWNNHCYWYNGESHNWGSAESVCQNWGGHLVTITSSQENAHVDSLCSGKCWTGLNDVQSEGNYTWSSGMPYNSNVYSNWRWAQPNNGGLFGNEDCVLMCQDCGWQAPSGQWQDEECNNTQAFVCEMAP